MNRRNRGSSFEEANEVYFDKRGKIGGEDGSGQKKDRNVNTIDYTSTNNNYDLDRFDQKGTPDDSTTKRLN